LEKTLSVIVIAGCTHRAGLVDEYERSLRDKDIEFHLEHVDPMPEGANSITMHRRINYWRKMAEQFKDYETIFITDAWDVLFFGTKQELLDKSPKTLLISAERCCYPNYQLADSIQGDTPWRYANNGMIVSSPEYLLEWIKKAEEISDLNILDQAWFNHRLSEGRGNIVLDTTTNLFYVVSATLEDGALRAKNGRPWNSKCDTFPNFLHFSGKEGAGNVWNIRMDEVRQMLQEEITQ